jgi:hypothetical protein
MICIDILYKNDLLLIENNVSERSISHKLAEYLQDEFPDWNVDCEYNRMYDQIKVLEGIQECSEQRSTDRIYPDIIVHERNTDKNLVVIEIKININDCCDIKKLEKLTLRTGKFSYKVGYFIRLSKEKERCVIRRFQGGREVS